MDTGMYEAIPLPQPADRELWRPIPGYPGYEVSSLGRVRSFWKMGRNGHLSNRVQRELSLRLNGRGYWMVSLKREGESESETIHRLVLKAFVGEPEAGRNDGRHIDGSRTRNDLNNLCWGARRDNVKDAVRHGTHIGGKGRPGSLNRESVLLVVELYRGGVAKSEIGRRVGTSKSNIDWILNGWTWSWLTGIEPKPRRTGQIQR